MKMTKVLTLIITAILAVAVVSCNNTATNEQHDDHMEKGHDEMMEKHEDQMEENIDPEQMDHQNHDQMQSSNTGSVKSPRKSSMANIGDTHIHIDYSAPSMRGRQIFGGLVGYMQVWTPGAHKATTIQFYEDVMVEGQPIPKGKYGLFTIPDKDQWTVIINKNNDMHLADDYTEGDDVVRFKVTPEKLQEPVEQLIFEVNTVGGNQGQVVLKWADVSIPISVTVKQ
ncbi:MAG: DUF2911 domain-containing protein [Candidatus Cyclobacteriaceae bacterium M2_1C_046]